MNSHEETLPGWLRGPTSKQKSALRDEWEAAVDPKTGQPCWRNNKTGEFTVPGVSKPHTWHEVVDKKTGLLYYWNPATAGDATRIGEPKPGPYGRSASFTQSEDGDSYRSLDSDSSLLHSSGKKNGDKEDKELSIVSLYNNPLGWLLLGMALFGIASQNWPQ
ncbi:hypothetical protein CEUSTIGMA_g5914.t1 [Chlamydomonas eustigma]|uniref:WW domain-containing protein n=1 Tax=Chlamydomonas eustigma TaxID=1157962 RepID=A0A250X5W8_9CHLO|nr:hypothetical protein CEUSTIGMA_g5914.t1 [Chlamydomonas eustigma]|eukprot:GAX78475.1 hypothetical protein CEUSTIGMA_g5914.t1 [Chlamydomonas eustigma]